MILKDWGFVLVVVILQAKNWENDAQHKHNTPKQKHYNKQWLVINNPTLWRIRKIYLFRSFNACFIWNWFCIYWVISLSWHPIIIYCTYIAIFILFGPRLNFYLASWVFWVVCDNDWPIGRNCKCSLLNNVINFVIF